MKHQLSSPKSLSFIEEIADKVFLLGFPRDFDFLPGQVIGLGTEKEGPRRLYSICSGNQDNEVHILFNVIEDGYLTPKLSDLIIGDKIWITEPRGVFLFDPSPAYWIATGTGIAPFYSMYRSGKYANKILLHGERYHEKFYFYDELDAHFGKNYIRCCSGEKNTNTYYGRVTDYLNEIEDLPINNKYYLCGSAEMVVETRDILIEKNIPFNRIVSEIYF